MLRKLKICIAVLVLFFFTACRKEDLAHLKDYKTLGTAAHDLLSSDTYRSLQIEINYMSGFEPDKASLDSLVVFLKHYVNKPEGINIVSNEIASIRNASLTLKDIVDIEKKNRRFFTEGNNLVVHILIANAAFTIHENMAIAYWNTSFCLFGERIFASSGNSGQITRSKLFATLLQHEFGHLMGLVGQGSPMQVNHRDEDNGAHCNNPSCLMYYGIETAESLGFNSFIPKLDAQCIADLKANGGK